MSFRQLQPHKIGQSFIWLLLLALPACNLWPTPPQPQPEALLPTTTATPTLAALLSPSPTALPATATPLPTPSPAVPTPETSSVTGRICYPGSRTPPMTLYLENTTTGEVLEQEVKLDQANFTLAAPPGEYIAYAQTVGTALTGSYSEAVACGLGPDCTDHRPRPFQVIDRQTTPSIDLCDWYDPPGVVSSPSEQSTAAIQVFTLQNVNVFEGPGLAYDTVDVAPAQTSALALGRSADGNWLQIDFPSEEAALGWIYAPLVQITAAPDILPVLDAPPLPSSGAVSTLAPSTDQFIPAAWSAQTNAGLMHVKGFIRDQAGQPVNGFSVLADNGTWSVLSHPSGPSNWFPDQQNGEWDLVLNNVTDAVGWWTFTIVSYDCPNFEQGFDAQCKYFTRLSEDQVIKIVYPDETIINADWVCQRDCDKGLKLIPTQE